MNAHSLLLMTALAIGLAPIAEAKIGLSTNLADVVIENARPGRIYNLREVKGVGFSLKNVGDASANVITEIVVPKKDKVQPGYEPIPDPSWVQVLPEKNSIPAGALVFFDVILRIPDDPSLIGKHYQFGIWSHMDTPGQLAAGLESRVRFSMGKGPETLEKEKKRKQMLTFNFELWPRIVYVIKAKAGKTYKIKKEEGKSVRLINKAEEPLVLNLKGAPWPKEDPLPEGYEAPPDPMWLSVDKSQAKVKGLSIIDLPLELNVPKGHEGKKYAFWLSASLPSGLTFTSGVKVLATIDASE